MKSSLRCTLLVPLSLGAGLTFAQPAEPTNSAVSSPAISTTPAPTTLDSDRPRVASPKLSSTLSAGITYNPPPPPKKKEPDAEEVDEREIDKPRNTIVRLPQVVVQGEKPPPIFSERSIYTSKGLAALAARRYLSSFHRDFLNRYTLPFIGMSSEQLGLMMYEEDERLHNIADTKEKIFLYQQTGNDAAAAQLTKDAQSTFMRREEFSEPLAPPSR